MFDHFYERSVINEQISVRQPHILTIIFAYALPYWILALVFKCSLLSTSFNNFNLDHPAIYEVVYFASEVAMIGFVVIAASLRYPISLWRPRPKQLSGGKCLVILVPILAYYLLRAFIWLNWLDKMTRSGSAEPNQIHNQFWSGSPYGLSLIGVILSSIRAVVTGAVLEEIIFTGFLLNIAVKKLGVFSAILIIPLIFTATHVIQRGLTLQLIPILLSGFTLVLIRLISGSLGVAILCHMLLNLVALTPALVEAYLFFNWFHKRGR